MVSVINNFSGNNVKSLKSSILSSTRVITSQFVMEVLIFITLILTTSKYGQGYSFDYEYFPHSDQEFSVRSRTIKSTVIVPQPNFDANVKKCRCDGNQVWNDRGCIDMQTYVSVRNLTTNQAQGFPTTVFGVTIGEVQCLHGEIMVVLRPGMHFSNEFSLLANGSLYWQKRAFDAYCFDHILDINGEPNDWQAGLCLPPPVIPRCCHDSSSCNNSLTPRTFSPPINVNETVLQWPGSVSEESVTMRCRDYESPINVSLSTSQANLRYLSGNVSLVWSPDNSGRNKQTEDYCVDSGMEGKEYIASVCHADQEAIQQLCSKRTCARKCCDEGEVMSGNQCVPVDDYTDILWNPTFIDANDLQSKVEPPEDLTFLYGLPTCCQSFLILNDDDTIEDTLLLLSNGSLFHSTDNTHETYLPTEYCIDNFLDLGVVRTKALKGSVIDAMERCTTIRSNVYPALLLVSSLFLGITFIVYVSVPDIRDKLHGRCLLSLIAALFVAYTVLASTKLNDGKIAPTLCSFFASLTHLSMLAAFFWLNVMCFDIWRTLRKTRTIVDGGWAAKRRFLLYCLYAWGCPLVITIVAIIIEYGVTSPGIIKPNFGTNCWFQTLPSHWLYLYGWILALVVANVIFFSLVATILCKAQNDSLLTRSREYNRERMLLYIKLFVVMGVTWIAEIISYQTMESQANVCQLFVVTDILNTLQGLFLFLVFVCKKSTLKKVKERWRSSGVKVGRRLTTSSQLSSSSSSSKKHDTRLSTRLSRLSTNSERSPDSPDMRVRSAASPLPLQTLQESPEEPLDSFPVDSDGEQLQETTSMIRKNDQMDNTDDECNEETMPLKTDSTTTTPLQQQLLQQQRQQQPMETHFDT